MLKLLCWLGIHRWGPWRKAKLSTWPIKFRECLRCRQIDIQPREEDSIR